MIEVIRYSSPSAFLDAVRPLLMAAEAENNLLLGFAEGLARGSPPAASPYLATAQSGRDVRACSAYLAPFKLLLSQSDRETIAALARDAFAAVPDLPGVTGPDPSASVFVDEWTRRSRAAARTGMLLRILQVSHVLIETASALRGRQREAVAADEPLLTSWTEQFLTESNFPEPVDAAKIVGDGISRRRLFVWDEGEPRSMAAWAGPTPNGVRLNFVYTPPGQRGRGYATANVRALSRHHLSLGKKFCWVYIDRAASPSRLFERIGYRSVSDITEFYLR